MTFDPYEWPYRDRITQQAREAEAQIAALRAEVAKLRPQVERLEPQVTKLKKQRKKWAQTMTKAELREALKNES